MKIPHADCIKLTMLFFIIFSFSKDTDLLADYVTGSAEESLVVRNIFVDDSYIINGNEAIILDVFSNDTIVNRERVRIASTSEAVDGEVIINDGRSLSYVPKVSATTEEETTDTFTYTTETEQNDGTATSEETTVLVTKINDELKY